MSLSYGSEILSVCTVVPSICELGNVKPSWRMRAQGIFHPPDADGFPVLRFQRHLWHRNTFCSATTILGGGVRGFCCKDSLRTKSSALSRGGTSPGRAADTMRGALNILEHMTLDWLVLGNVDPMEDAGSALDA